MRLLQIVGQWTRHYREHEPIVAFASDGLDGGRGHPGLAGEKLSEPADALDVAVGTLRIDDLALAHDIVDDEDSADM